MKKNKHTRKRLLVIGAHPDDAEFHAGGLMLQWVGAGHKLMILSLTNGCAGHHTLPPRKLSKIRRKEAITAANLLDAQIQVWNTPDGALEPTLPLRNKLIGTIRQYQPDLIVTHRPADYHPDHRAVAQLVQDATYLLQVPNIVEEVAPLRDIPPVLLTADHFTYPRPFRPDWVLDTTTSIGGIVELLHCHASQVYEWLPHTEKVDVPTNNKKGWLRSWYSTRPKRIAKKYAQGEAEFAEAFEISEYGGHFSPDLFPLKAITSAADPKFTLADEVTSPNE